MRGEAHDRLRYATVEAPTLSPLPCWEHLSTEKQKQRIAEGGRRDRGNSAKRRWRAIS
jgi:hypothetical protein